MEKNDVINLVIELDWPRKCFPLMHGDPDDFVMRFARHIEKATWTIILPAGTKVYVDAIGLRPEEDDYEVNQRVEAAGGSEVRLTVKDIEPYRRFGVRLDQK